MKSRKPRSGRVIENKNPANTNAPAQPQAKPFVLTVTQVRALLILILAIATFLRVYRLDSVPPGLFTDEAMDGNNAVEALETGHFQVFYPENHGREGIFINLTAPFVYIFGSSPWAVRMPTVIFGILNVWIVYALTARFFFPPVALLAAFFNATSLWQLIASRFSNRANAAPFFLALTVYLLLIGMDRVRQSKPWAPTILLGGAVYGLGFHIYTAHRATPLLIGALMVYFFLQARTAGWVAQFWKAVLCFGGAVAVAVGPLLFYFIQHPSTLTDRMGMVSVFNQPHPFLIVALNAWKMAQMFFVTGDANWRHNIAGQRELFWPVAVLFAVGVALAVAAVWTRIRGRTEPESCFPYALALGWLIVGVVPTIFTTDGVPHAVRAQIIAPAVFMLIAAGAWRAYAYLSRFAPPPVRTAVATIFLLVCCYEPYHMYFDVWAVDPNVSTEFYVPLVEVAARVNAVPREVPKYIAVARNTDLANGTPTVIAPIVFLTKSYTAKDREAANIHYVTKPPGDKADARAFCSQVVAANPGARVFCLQ